MSIDDKELHSTTFVFHRAKLIMPNGSVHRITGMKIERPILDYYDGGRVVASGYNPHAPIIITITDDRS